MYILKLISLPFAWLLPIAFSWAFSILWDALFSPVVLSDGRQVSSPLVALCSLATVTAFGVAAAGYTQFILRGSDSFISKWMCENRPKRKELKGEPSYTDWR